MKGMLKEGAKPKPMSVSSKDRSEPLEGRSTGRKEEARDHEIPAHV
jgi:hypothetical protein